MKRYYPRNALVMLMVLAATQTVWGQTVEETPEAVTEKLFERARKGDWAGYAQLMHPSAMKRLKEMFRPIIAADKAAGVGTAFFNVNSVAQFDKLTDNQAFERLMRGLTKNVPGYSDAISGAQATPIGHIEEAPDLAHVVYRMTATTQGITVNKTTVLTLKKHGNTWRGLLTGDFEGLAAALARPAPPVNKPATKKPAAKPTTKTQTKSTKR